MLTQYLAMSSFVSGVRFLQPRRSRCVSADMAGRICTRECMCVSAAREWGSQYRNTDMYSTGVHYLFQKTSTATTATTATTYYIPFLRPLLLHHLFQKTSTATTATTATTYYTLFLRLLLMHHLFQKTYLALDTHSTIKMMPATTNTATTATTATTYDTLFLRLLLLLARGGLWQVAATLLNSFSVIRPQPPRSNEVRAYGGRERGRGRGRRRGIMYH